MNVGRTPLSSMNLEFVEQLYAEFLREPLRVPEGFRQWFETLGHGEFEYLSRSGEVSCSHEACGEIVYSKAARTLPSRKRKCVSEEVVNQERLAQLVRAYRECGHLAAKVDPLGLARPSVAVLDLANHGLSPLLLEKQFSAETLGGPDVLTLREILDRLNSTYCRSIGVQFRHIAD